MRRPSVPTTISLIALFIALGGTSYAVIKLPKNSVGSREIKNKSIRSTDLAPATRIGKRGPRGAQGPAGPAGQGGSGTATAPEAWKPLQTVSPWQTYGGVWPTAGYRKDAAGRVFLRGLVKKDPGALAGEETIAVLPPGYTPTTRHLYTVTVGAGSVTAAGRVDITPGGEIIWESGPTGDPDYTSLDNISFWTN